MSFKMVPYEAAVMDPVWTPGAVILRVGLRESHNRRLVHSEHMVPVHGQEWGNSLLTVPDILVGQLVDAVSLPRSEAFLVGPSCH